jgi:small subunit ribosomal protein S17
MNKRRHMIGVVTSNKMQKTVVVQIRRTYQHRLYKKTVHSYNKVMAHDELGCEPGDQVMLIESRPISANKQWVVQEILRRSKGVDVVEETDLEEQT